MSSGPRCPRLIGLGLLAFGVACLSAGCGGGAATAHVSGKVLLQNGKPLPGGTVTFYPQERGPGKNPVSATIKPDGSYEAPAVPVGRATITVSNAALDPRAGTPAFAGGGNPLMGKNMSAIGPPKDALKGVEGPAPAKKPEGTFIQLDPKYASPERSGLTYEVEPGSQVHNIEGIVAIGRAEK
jgi:hypothetical protein